MWHGSSYDYNDIITSFVLFFIDAVMTGIVSNKEI